MSKILSLQNFLSDARQLRRISSTSHFDKKNLPTNRPQFIQQSTEE